VFQILSSISAVPCPKRFIDPAVGIVGCLGAREFLLHTGHPGAKRVAAGAALRLRGFESRLAGVGGVVRSTALGVKATLFGFAFLASPSGGLCHN
jgi:hypothetical protein